jgi:succinyl-CoA synthetase alpha subunit
MLAISTHKVAQIILMGHELDRAEGELRGFLETLNEDEQAEIVAIMWIGRGSFEPEDFAEALSTARNEATTPTADYLIGTPHLSDHLEAGLEALGVDPTKAEDDLM